MAKLSSTDIYGDLYVDGVITGKASSSINADNANKVGGYSVWIGTQEQYNALTTKDTNTLYFIKE